MRVLLTLQGSPSAIAAFLATVPETLTCGAPDTPALTAMPMPTTNDEDDGPTNDSAPATDANGLPWDARIHAKTKGLNADKTWRKQRNVDPALVAAVEAELRGSAPMPVAAPAAIPAPVPMPVAIPMTAPMPAPAPVPMAAAPMPVAAPAPLPMPVAAMPMPVAAMPAPVAAPAAEGTDFTAFMAHLTMKMQTGAVNSDDLVALVNQINAAYAAHGHPPLGAITDLQSDPAKLQFAIQCLQHGGKW